MKNANSGRRAWRGATTVVASLLALSICASPIIDSFRTDGLTMSIYSSLMVAATPICNSIFSALLAGSGYDQAADVALGTAAQSIVVQHAISISYIWVETVCYIIGGLLLLIFWTVEKNLPAEQAEIAARKAKQ